MTTRTIYNEGDYTRLCTFLAGRKMPYTITVEEGVKRSTDQNRLAFMWYAEIAQQKDDLTIDDVRALCKLEIGVPILRATNETFREKYDLVVRPLPYETKLGLMTEPIDFQVTSAMTVKQMTEYLNRMQQYWSEQGVQLTDPEGVMA